MNLYFSSRDRFEIVSTVFLKLSISNLRSVLKFISMMPSYSPRKIALDTWSRILDPWPYNQNLVFTSASPHIFWNKPRRKIPIRHAMNIQSVQIIKLARISFSWNIHKFHIYWADKANTEKTQNFLCFNITECTSKSRFLFPAW